MNNPYQCSVCGQMLGNAGHACGGTATYPMVVKSPECNHNAGWFDGDCVVCTKASLREVLDALELLTAKLESEGETHPFVGLARGVIAKYASK